MTLPYQPFPDAIAGHRIRTDFRVWLWVYGMRRGMHNLGAAEWLSRFLEIARAVFYEAPVIDEEIVRGVLGFSDGKGV
jgi:hypothetical protein